MGKYYQISLHAMLQSTWHAIFTVASYYSFTDGARTKRITVFTLVFTVIVPWTTVEQRVFKSCEECPTGVQWDIFPSSSSWRLTVLRHLHFSFPIFSFLIRALEYNVKMKRDLSLSFSFFSLVFSIFRLPLLSNQNISCPFSVPQGICRD